MKEFSRVDKKAKTKWRLGRLIGLIFLALISVVVMMVAVEEGFALAAGIICGIVLLLQLANLIIYPIIEYIQWSYLIDDDRIEIKKGIFWRSHTVIPISRIQHVSSKSGPMQNIFGLATVEINTAGGVHTIDEVSKATAAQICELLKNIVNLKVAEKRAADSIKAEKDAAQASDVAEVESDA